jgi:branched-chain amino acid aminotransferase
VALEHEWVPKTEGSSLYLRPFMFASEARLGVKPSDEYYFMIVASPVGPYYSQPVKVKVETEYVRAAEGGTGYAKCGGNYGGSLYPAMLARKAGFDQVLWTDAKTHSFIEESGTMNVMFRFGDVVVTPSLSSSILDGVTRDSILTLAEDMGYGVEEREVPVAELEQRLQNGSCKEAFGAGTAALVAPIEYIDIHGESYRLNIQPDALMYQIKKRLTDIRIGSTEDIYGWNYIVKP